MARTPSSAISAISGEVSGAYSASTAWAIALMPLVTESGTGRERVRAGS